MARPTGGAAYALLSMNNVEYLKKAISLVRWLGYPLRQSIPVSFGGGGYAQLGRLLIGGFGGGGGTRGEDEHYTASLGAGFGGAQVGFALINAAWLRVYPLAGFGGGGEGFAAFRAASEDLTAYAGSYGTDAWFGLGVELRLPLPLARRVRPLIGLRAGLRRRVTELSADGDVELPPQPRWTPFCHLLVGLGV